MALLAPMKRLLLAATLVVLAAPVSSVAGAADKPKVVLLGAGSGKKVKLRFAPKKGAKQTATFHMQVTLGMKIAGQTLPPNAAPATAVTMTTKVTDVAKNGDITYDFEFTDFKAMDAPGVDPQMTATVQSSVKELVGTKGTGRVSSTGSNLGLTFELPPTASAQARQTLSGMQSTMEQMSSPVPSEAVGKGAKWRVDSLTEHMGVKINQSMTYTVKAIRGSVVDLAVDVTQNAASTESSLPGLPPGMSASIGSMASKGGGTLVLDMMRVVPSKSDMNIDMLMKAQMEARGQTQDMEMSMKLDVKLTSK